MIVGKLLGVYLAVITYDLPIGIAHETGQFYTIQLYFTEATQTFITNSVSNAVMLAVMNVVTLFVVMRYYLYRKTEGNPRTVVKLAKLNLLKWITGQDNSFIKIFVWTFFLLATNALVISDAINQNTFGILGALALLSTLLFMWGLVKTFELETATIYPSKSSSEDALL